MAGGDLGQGLGEFIPQGTVFRLGGGVVVALVALGLDREQGCGGQGAEGVAVMPVGALGAGGAVQMDGLEEGELTGGVVVAPRLGLVLGVVVALELLALETGGDAVGGSHQPLQIGVRLVMAGGGVDHGVVHVAVAPGGEGGHVGAEQLGEGGLQAIPGEGGIGGMLVAVPDPATGLLAPAVELDMGVQAVCWHLQPGTLGELAQVVQVGAEGETGGGVEQGMRVHGHSLGPMGGD